MDINELYEVINSSKNIAEQIDILRKKQKDFKRLKYMLEENNKVICAEEIDNIENGRINITYNEIEFECLFNKKESSNYLMVIFSGAKMENDELPLFKRWTYFDLTDCTVLSISDPMLKKYEGLHLGWYYGTASENYLDYLSEIIKVCATKLKIDYKNVLFYASSGGGYAALYCACKVEGSTAVVINPQIKLSIDGYGKTFERITGNNLSIKDDFERNNLPELILKSKKSRFILLENLRSKTDMKQLDSLC